MPRNRVMYFGVLVLAASVLLWLGAVLLDYIRWILPWSTGVGIALILIGMIMELRRSSQAKAGASAAEPSVSTGTPTQNDAP